MPAILLKLPEHLLKAASRCAEALQLTRAEYIRPALEETNLWTRNHHRSRRLRDASLKVRRASMRINKEFAAVERDSEA